MSCRPSARVTASIPALGFGRSSINDSALQVLPPSFEVAENTLPCSVRPTASSFSPPTFSRKRMLGWIAPIVVPSLIGAVADQFLPPSLLHSKCTCHLLGSACDSVLDPATMVPSASCTGLFLIGPRMPLGRRRALLQLRPSSALVRISPHHSSGDGPTL